MFSYTIGKNIPWSNPEYKTPRLYLDPIKQIQQRNYAEQKKGEKDKNHVTKKGHFLDDTLKIAK